jgi:hypothetical protein
MIVSMFPAEGSLAAVITVSYNLDIWSVVHFAKLSAMAGVPPGAFSKTQRGL